MTRLPQGAAIRIPTTTYRHPQTTSRKGKRDDLGGQFFRSSAEANLARLWRALGIQWLYEPRTFRFPVEGGCNAHYIPDFQLDLRPFADGPRPQNWPGVLHRVKPDLCWVEAKGWMTDDSQVRLRRFVEFYPEEAANCILLIHGDPRKAMRKWRPVLRRSLDQAGVIVADIRPLLQLGRLLRIPHWEGRS